MGEHIEIKPDPVPQKKLSKREQEFYNLWKGGKLKPEIEDIMNLSQAMFYFFKGQCKKKGWIE